MIKKLCILTIVGISTLTTQAAPEWQRKVGAFKNGSHEKLPATRLVYNLSWKGVLKSGTMSFDFNKTDKRYPGALISQASGRSTGAAYAIYPYTFTMTSFMKGKDNKPILFVANEKDGKEKVYTKNKYTAKGTTHYSLTDITKTGKKEERNHLFKYGNVHDPLSAILYIRKQPLKNGDKVNLCLHPFASPMYAEITVLGRENHRGRACIKMDVKLHKIDTFKLGLKDYKKLKKATLWISDDKDRVMVELRSKVFIGDVRAVLQSQTPIK